MPEGPLGVPRPLASREPLYEVRFVVKGELDGMEEEELGRRLVNREMLIARVQEIEIYKFGYSTLVDTEGEDRLAVVIKIEPTNHSPIDDALSVSGNMVRIIEDEVENMFGETEGSWEIL